MVDQMWASNAKDEFNANVFTKWQPGRTKPVNPLTGNLYGDETY